MKFIYSLAALAVAGTMALSAQAEETNLMANAITGYQALTTPTAPWLAYNTNSGETGSGNGWQFRAQGGGMNDAGQAAQLFFRWNDNNSVWVYAYEVELEGGYNYTFTCDATTNDNKNNTLLVATSTTLADAKELRTNTLAGTSSYKLDGVDSGKLWTTPVKVSKEFQTIESGKYYLMFYCTTQTGNIIVRIANTSLVQGEKVVIDYEALYKSLKEEVEEALATVSFDTGSEGEAIYDALYYNGTDYEAAYTQLNTAWTTFKEALPSYQAYAEATQAATQYLINSEEASQEAIMGIMKLLYPTPQTAAAAAEKAEALTTATRALVESICLAEGWNAVLENVFGTWSTEGASWNANQSGEAATLANGEVVQPYWDYYGSNWTSELSQTLENLPAGHYRLSVLSRASADGLETFQLYAGEESVDLTQIGNKGNIFGWGWNMSYVDFTITEAQDVKVGVKAVTTKSNIWASFVRFQLVRIPVVIPTLLVNGKELEGETIEGEGDAVFEFEIYDDTEVWYKWTPNTQVALAEVSNDEFTKYEKPVTLTGNGKFEYYAVQNGVKSDIKSLSVDFQSGVSEFGVDSAEAEYYTLDGVKVAKEGLEKGIYVVRQGGKTFKAVVK